MQQKYIFHVFETLPAQPFRHQLNRQGVHLPRMRTAIPNLKTRIRMLKGMVITWALDLSQSRQRKIKKLCDLCEIIRKCLQFSKFLMAEIRTNP